MGAELIPDRRRWLKLITALVGGSCFPRAHGDGQPNPMLESRAILDEGLNWVGASAAERVCSRVGEAGFNVLVPCVWHGRGTSWPSSVAPWDDRLAVAREPDPLAQLCTVAARFSLEVHPWFTVGLRQRDFFPEFTNSMFGHSFDFHDPHFRDFIVSVILEVVERYPIHGINLDFVRFNSPKPGAEADQEAAVADVVRRASNASRKIRPGIVVSVDAAPWMPTITQFGQDAPKWADEGLVDVIYSMQYQYDPDFETSRRVRATMKRPEALVVMVGNFDREGAEKKVVPRSPSRVNDLIELARSAGMGNGVALYYYGMLTNEQINALRAGVFRRNAVPRWQRASDTVRSPSAASDMLSMVSL